MNNNDVELNKDNHALSKRSVCHHKHHYNPRYSRQYVPCKFNLIRCCLPNVCVKRRFRTDKCL
ncbi:unnamed protein product, partial [Rotaria sp. Silwood1]